MDVGPSGGLRREKKNGGENFRSSPPYPPSSAVLEFDWLRLLLGGSGFGMNHGLNSIPCVTSGLFGLLPTQLGFTFEVGPVAGKFVFHAFEGRIFGALVAETFPPIAIGDGEVLVAQRGIRFGTTWESFAPVLGFDGGVDVIGNRPWSQRLCGCCCFSGRRTCGY